MSCTFMISENTFQNPNLAKKAKTNVLYLRYNRSYISKAIFSQKGPKLMSRTFGLTEHTFQNLFLAKKGQN